MGYLVIPREVSSDEVRAKEFSLSPRSYHRVDIPNSKTCRVGDLLADYIQGTEVGSLAYLQKSPCNFIRTKALQPWATLTEQKGGSVIPIHPRAWEKAVEKQPKRVIQDGDLLYARGGSVGEIALAEECGKAITSGHILKLEWKSDPLYCYAFMKHDICKSQQVSALKGSIQALDNFKISTLLDCKIPFPNQADAPRAIAYVSALMQAIVEKEKAIRTRNIEIDAAIAAELKASVTKEFVYSYPTSHEVSKLGRLDASMYCESFKRKVHFIANYKHGVGTYEDLNFEIGRGQNLQVSCIGLSQYSDTPKPNWYRLVAPTDVSEYRTVTAFRYLGSAKKLGELKQGDVIFGAEGFCKGRVIVLADEIARTISNIHGVIFHPRDGNMTRGIFLGCYLGYLRALGLIDAIGAGGSGGSLAISYMHHVPIPKFPDDVQGKIAALYHNPTPAPSSVPTLDEFVQWHRNWNADLGIWELDREMKALQNTLREVQDEIIRGKTVDVPFA